MWVPMYSHADGSNDFSGVVHVMLWVVIQVMGHVNCNALSNGSCNGSYSDSGHGS